MPHGFFLGGGMKQLSAYRRWKKKKKKMENPILLINQDIRVRDKKKGIIGVFLPKNITAVCFFQQLLNVNITEVTKALNWGLSF